MENEKAEVGFLLSRVTTLIPRKLNPYPRPQAIERTPEEQSSYLFLLNKRGSSWEMHVPFPLIS